MIAFTDLNKPTAIKIIGNSLPIYKKLYLLTILLALITLPLFLLGKPLIIEKNTSNCTHLWKIQNTLIIDTLLDDSDTIFESTKKQATLVKGTVWDVNGNALQSVRVIPISIGKENSYSITREDGQFQFELISSSDYKIIPFKNDNVLNGVNADDLLLIKKHILGIDPLYSPYQLIAADVNDSGTITVFDIVQIQRIILAINTEFERNTSWRFIEATFPFLGNNPLVENYPEVCKIYSLERDKEMNFVGIKIGDINGDARPNNLKIGEYRTTEK